MKRASEVDPRWPSDGMGHASCWYDDDCWVIAVATFFAISRAAAYRLITGKELPITAVGCVVNLGIERELLERRLIELGMKRVDVDYRTLRRHALVLAYWDSRAFRTAHLVVWDGKNRCRIDPCWRDTLLLHEKRTIIHAVFVRR